MGEPNPQAIRGHAVCGGCGHGLFRLKIYDCGYERSHCAVCDTVWEAGWQAADGAAADRGPGVNERGAEAVASVRDVAADLVQPAAGAAAGRLRGGRLTLSSTRPWLGLGMSRSTWYERRREGRLGLSLGDGS